ncbi:MAG: nitroreductase [Actinomycetota bacterium]|nr:nitroreductase [Actinomycetota bacterium]
MTTRVLPLQADDADTRAAADRTRALRWAAVRATLAPSVHNSQPWRLVLGHDHLDIRADWDRQLRVLDPRGRQLQISCGCAVFNARVALAAAGYQVDVHRCDDGARLTLLGKARRDQPISLLDRAIERRRTNRRRFADVDVPEHVVGQLVQAANAEGAVLVPITRPEDRELVARLNQRADQAEVQDPAYRAELRAWTSNDPRRLDGVPASAVAYAGVGARNTEAVPIRVFDTDGSGWLPEDNGAGQDQCLLLLGTMQDGPAGWLAVGEALEHVLLEIADLGYAASPLTQLIEVAETHKLLRQHLRLAMHPSVLLRVGLAPETLPTRRRRLVDVLTDTA